MPSYKLTYFNGKARAENVRYLFALADVTYEDHRIVSEKWPELKPATPLGQLPVCEIDGKQHPHSRAIWRYLAKEFGLYGANNEEALAIDVVCETAEDFWPGFFKIGHAEEAKKAELRAELEKDGAAKVVVNLEKLLKQNNGGSGWFVGDKITLADVVAFNTIYDFLPFALKKKEGEFDLKDNQALKGFLQRFKSNEKIADWLKKRPVTEF